MPSASEPTAHADLTPDTRRRFQQGSLEALADVYDRYHRSVWTVTMSVIRADHLAQEAVQDAFLRAWRAAGSYDPELDLGPWLMTIARRAALDLLRREFRPTRGGHAVEQDGVVEDPGIERAWNAWQVQEALGKLGEDERLIVRLSFFEDLTHTQIADRLGLPLGTVKSRSYRAHRRLAELLEHLRDDGRDSGGDSGGDDGVDAGNRSAPPGRTGSAQRSGEGGGW